MVVRTHKRKELFEAAGEGLGMGSPDEDMLELGELLVLLLLSRGQILRD